MLQPPESTLWLPRSHKPAIPASNINWDYSCGKCQLTKSSCEQLAFHYYLSMINKMKIGPCQKSSIIAHMLRFKGMKVD